MLQAEEPGHSNLSCPSEGETGYANLNCAATEDACGCAPLHGWSNSTGVGCCKLGSVTSPQEETACQGSSYGNTDCDVNGVDACGCEEGFGWSFTTGRGCCKLGSITQEVEEAVCLVDYGNTECRPEISVSVDECGCISGTGWSETTGRGCCKPGSITQEFEITACQATGFAAFGNTNCDVRGVDNCGCQVGFGWSLTTGVGCCKRGSITQEFEVHICLVTPTESRLNDSYALPQEDICQESRGNRECGRESSNEAEVYSGADACGCRDNFGWSVSTGRGCCKLGSNTSIAEEAECPGPDEADFGNMDCDVAGVDGVLLDACGCPEGFGWSVSSGTPCCQAGSVTSEVDETSCWSAFGFMDCTRDDARNSCRYANDEECDEPQYCPIGTDTNDCEGATESCLYTNDGECDEITFCPAGTDTDDCCPVGGQQPLSDDADCSTVDGYPDGPIVADCPYKNDGECDENLLGLCDPGTDYNDCCLGDAGFGSEDNFECGDRTPHSCDIKQCGDNINDGYGNGYDDGANSCGSAYNGRCEEPFRCAPGTDSADCMEVLGDLVDIPCMFTNDGECDEVRYCKKGTDTADCCPCPEGQNCKDADCSATASGNSAGYGYGNSAALDALRDACGCPSNLTLFGHEYNYGASLEPIHSRLVCSLRMCALCYIACPCC